MDIKEFIKERIEKNHLPLDLDECLDIVKKYETVYPNTTDIKRFFYLVLNKVGGILNDIDVSSAELFGNLKVKGKSDITFYEFDFEDDYLEWQTLRAGMYARMTTEQVRLLNYVELSTMNMISDLFTKCKYHMTSKRGKTFMFNKTGYGTTGTDQNTLSFIKYMGGKFKEGYTFRPMPHDTVADGK